MVSNQVKYVRKGCSESEEIYALFDNQFKSVGSIVTLNA